MGKITVTTLQEGCKSLGVKTDSKKAKELEALIDAALKKVELGYECPSCKKDIPDVKACPYCGESFEDGEEDSNEDTENTDANESENVDKAVDDATKEVAEKLAADEKKDDKKADKKDDKKASDKKADKKDDKKASDKKPADKKDDKKASDKKPADPAEIEKKNKEFDAIVVDLDSTLKDFEKRQKKTGISYFKDGKRIMKAVSTGKVMSFEFNSAVTTEGDDITTYTEAEAKDKHMGTVRAVYEGSDKATVLKLTKEALKTFGK